jgi:hypothetical protein
MHKRLEALLVMCLALVFSAAAQASTFVPENSPMGTALGDVFQLGPWASPGTESKVSLSDNGSGGHILQIEPTVWTTVNLAGGTSIYTGTPLISNIYVTVKNQAGTLASGYSFTNYVGDNSVIGPYFGGEMRLSGQMVLTVLKGVINIVFDMTHAGGPPGGRTMVTAVGIPMTITYGPWVTGGVTMTNITTNIISVDGLSGIGVTLHPSSHATKHTLSTGGGYVSVSGGLPLEARTWTFYGTNQLMSAGQDGSVTMVTPMRSLSSSLGNQPAAGWLTLSFVPEPGTLLLLVSGAVGLAVVGRRRMRG